MVEVNNKIEAFTLYMYNKMICDKNIRNLKNIRYYLYFINYVNNDILIEEVMQTRTYLIWSNQEELMINLIEGDKSYKNYNYIMLDKEKQLCDDVYEMFKSYSSNVLRDISFTIIDPHRLCDNERLVNRILQELEEMKDQYKLDNHQKVYINIC